MPLTIFRTQMRLLKHELGSQLMKRVNMSRTTLYNWTKDRGGTSPQLRDFVRFCEALRINPCWLALGVGAREEEAKTDLAGLPGRVQSIMDGIDSSARRERLKSWGEGDASPRLDNLIRLANDTNSSFLWLMTGRGRQTPFEAPRAIHSGNESMLAQRETSEFEELERLLGDVRALAEVCQESHEIHAVAHIRRDLDALIREIQRLYPNVVQRAPSDRNGDA